MAIVKFADVGSLGLNLDLPSHDLPESPLTWSNARNVSFRSGFVSRVEGYKASFDTTPTAAPLGMFAAKQNDGTKYIVAGTTNKIFCYSGTTENELTGSTTPAATADTKWSGGIFTGFVVLNESTVAPQYIAIQSLSTAGATNVADLTNWPASTTAKVIRPFKYFLVAAGMTESATYYPYKVRWSNAAVPGALPSSWTATTTNDAGSVDLSGNFGAVVDMLPFGDQLAIYRTDGITMMRYVGGTDTVNRLVMAFNDVPGSGGTGILSMNCVVDVPGIGHVVLSPSDMYVFNGTGTKSILDGRMRNWLRSSLDATHGTRSFLVHHAAESEVWACIVEYGRTSAATALIFNYAVGTCSLRSIPNATCGVHAQVSDGTQLTWTSVTGEWSAQASTWAGVVTNTLLPLTVLGSADTKLYSFGVQYDENGSSMVSLVERTYMALGDAQRVKFIRTVWPRFDADAGHEFEIRVGTSMSVDEPVDWQIAVTYTQGTSRKVDVNRLGRFLSIQIRTTSGGVWRLRGFDVDMQPQGLW